MFYRKILQSFLIQKTSRPNRIRQLQICTLQILSSSLSPSLFLSISRPFHIPSLFLFSFLSLLFPISSLCLFSIAMTVITGSISPECQSGWTLPVSLFGENLRRYNCVGIPASNACHWQYNGLVPSLEMEKYLLARNLPCWDMWKVMWCGVWSGVECLWLLLSLYDSP